MKTLADQLNGPLYQAYSYSYPHKSAYRPFREVVQLEQLWAEEDKSSLFLYLHVPFCEMRCGFCNLFALSKPETAWVDQYLSALQRQAEVTGELLGEYQFVRFALGGGTPSYLSVKQLEALFCMAQDKLKVNLAATPTAIEVSPGTLNNEKIALLEQFHVNRVSVGVQSFDQTELHHLARRQKAQDMEQALNTINDSKISTLNIDLIYGIPGQTLASWMASLQRALEYHPQELYLYPLYVRPNSGLGSNNQVAATLNNNLILNNEMLSLHRQGRDYLLNRGYRQVSMRMFKVDDSSSASEPEYSCQDDGMIGLGPGARSYTYALHYSSQFASKHGGVSELIKQYNDQTAAEFSQATYGYWLSQGECQRRYLIQSLFLLDGVDRIAFKQRFAIDCLELFPQLNELAEHGLAHLTQVRIQLTAAGIERADALAPWLASAEVLQKMAQQE